MVEYDWRGQSSQKVLDLDDLVAEHVDLHMPAEIVDAVRQGLKHVDRGGAGLNEIEADPANS